jgi:peptide/nickel transport system ATP-binding protein
MENSILTVNDLKTYYFTRDGVVKAVDGVSFGLKRGECLAIVGESGCGKTATALSILRLIEYPGRIVSGEVIYGDENLLALPPDKIREIRGNRIAMIFQDPQSSLNPVLSVGEQIAEPMRLHLRLGKQAALLKSVELMEQVGVPNAKDREKEFPHQFSGGMKQRVMIATALSCEPEILIADEPTTALDATVKVQILEIFRELKKRWNMSIIYITHDMGTVAGIADRVLVMYGGRVAEVGDTEEIFYHPMHPYTQGLLNCLPNVSLDKERLTSIPGVIPSLINPPEGCIFCARCEKRLPACSERKPEEVRVSERHSATCHLYR